MAEIIEGKCLLMCPVKERLMREREGLLHKYEIDERTRHLSRPKADPTKTVKCFARSAAGQILTDPKQLRPAPILLTTVKFLFTQIATRSDVPWSETYDFIFDRLRSVRQDITIQRIEARASIQLYELFVRFHVYAGQRLCELGIRQFDSKINDQHLLQCIKQLLKLYDDVRNNVVSTGHDTNAFSIAEAVGKLTLNDSQSEMEALYILVNIGDVTAINRGLNLPPELRRSEDVRLAIKISLACYLRNYRRSCRLIKQLSPILVCAVTPKLRNLRRDTWRIMSLAYNNSILTFPTYKLQQLLLYNSEGNVTADCELFGLEFTKDGILFQKSKFNDKVALANPEMYYSSQAMHNFLPHILLSA